jgi:hypothetical protein
VPPRWARCATATSPDLGTQAPPATGSRPGRSRCCQGGPSVDLGFQGQAEEEHRIGLVMKDKLPLLHGIDGPSWAATCTLGCWGGGRWACRICVVELSKT